MNPSPTVSQQGVGAASADQLNTYVQTVLNVAQLRTFAGLSNMSVLLLGTTTPGDGGQAFYYWNATATGPDNGTSIIQPTYGAAGAWLQLTGV